LDSDANELVETTTDGASAAVDGGDIWTEDLETGQDSGGDAAQPLDDSLASADGETLGSIDTSTQDGQVDGDALDADGAPEPCTSDADCADDDLCTVETCLGTGDCLVKPVDDCCLSIEECPIADSSCAFFTCEGNQCVLDVSSCEAPVAHVQTWAATGEQGYVDGDIGLAQLSQPRGLSLHAGILVIVDEMADVIRYADTDSEIIGTLAGGANTTMGDWNSGTTPWMFGGYKDGPVESALFDIPIEVMHDSETNAVLVSDCFNHAIRSIAEGQVTTLAGNGTAGNELGPATGAVLSCPSGLARSNDGALYIGDSSNHRVVRLSDGVIEAVAGTGVEGYADGVAADAQFNEPSMLLFLEDGTLLIADSANHVIRALKDNQVTTWAGNGVEDVVDGPLLEASFNYPLDMAAHPLGGLLVTDHFGNRIRWIANDEVFTLSGNGTEGVVDGWGTQAQHSRPHSIEVDESGLVYVTELTGFVVRTLTLSAP